MPGVLERETALAARARALQLGERLLNEQRDEPPTDRGLAGLAGLALAFRALAQATGENRYREAAFDALRRASQCDDRPGIGLFEGLSGLRAVAALYGSEQPALQRLVQQCDGYVEDHISPLQEGRVHAPRDYDLIGGWAGARLARCVDGPRARDRLFEQLLWLLDDQARWRCPHPLRVNEPPENDLGLAHGIAGVLTAIALTTDTIDAAECALVLREASALREHAVVREDLVAWPGSIQSSELSRPAWCYGAPGIGAALFWVGKRFQDDGLADFALGALVRTALHGPKDWGLHNHALCHGTFGNALIMASVGVAANTRTLLDCVERSVRLGLDALANDGACWANRPDLSRYDASGELDGAAGIALALLTLSGAADSQWFRLHGLLPI